MLWAAVLFIAVTLVTYVIFYLIPADPARLFAGKSAGPDEIARVRHFLGLDRPWYVQYWNFFKRLILGPIPGSVPFSDTLGRSFANRQNVVDIVKDAAPV